MGKSNGFNRRGSDANEPIQVICPKMISAIGSCGEKFI
jgi:hypothetical protein